MNGKPAIYIGPRRDLYDADATIRPQMADPTMVWAKFFRVNAEELCKNEHAFPAEHFEVLT